MMRYEQMILLAFSLLGLPTSSSLRILAVLPFPMKSHQIVFNSVLSELVKRGHEVEVFSNSPLNANASNYRHVNVRTHLETLLEKTWAYGNIISTTESQECIRPHKFQIFARNLSDEVLSTPQIKRLLGSNATFDVVILETFFAQEALIGFGHRFNAPVIAISSFDSFSLIDSIMGNPNPLAYQPTYHLPYSSDMSFFQRLINFVAVLSEIHYSYYHHLPEQQRVMEKHFQSYSPPPLMHLLSNTAVVLLSIQPEVSISRPWIPNMIPVGGLHISPNRTSLSKKIQEFLDKAHDGFIYFSLGSTFSGATMPHFIQNAFIESFKGIDQRVLWKIDQFSPNLPSNVMTVEWAQQMDILAHPRCQLFITHGGLLSLTEAVHFAVPIVGIPLFADQPRNVIHTEKMGFGLHLKLTNITASSVSWAINEVIHNPRFKKTASKLSEQMRDRQNSPLGTAVHWVEYVAKHRGPTQLRSPARTMSFYTYYLLDILLFTICTLISGFIITVVMIRKMYRLAVRRLISTNIANYLKNNKEKCKKKTC